MEDENNSIEELNKLAAQIKKTKDLLNNNSDIENELKKLKKHKTLLSLLSLFLLFSVIGMYVYNNRVKKNTNSKLPNNFLSIHKDSINLYKNYYLNSNTDNLDNVNITDLSSEKIIYNVQLGAFHNFNLTSNELMNLKEFTKDGYHKLAVANYKTYKEALSLKKKLKRLGFRDCFIIAQSFGETVNITDALTLSEETEYLH